MMTELFQFEPLSLSPESGGGVEGHAHRPQKWLCLKVEDCMRSLRNGNNRSSTSRRRSVATVRCVPVCEMDATSEYQASPFRFRTQRELFQFEPALP